MISFFCSMPFLSSSIFLSCSLPPSLSARIDASIPSILVRMLDISPFTVRTSILFLCILSAISFLLSSALSSPLLCSFRASSFFSISASTLSSCDFVSENSFLPSFSALSCASSCSSALSRCAVSCDSSCFIPSRCASSLAILGSHCDTVSEKPSISSAIFATSACKGFSCSLSAFIFSPSSSICSDNKASSCFLAIMPASFLTLPPVNEPPALMT